jgi:Signal transduction histidine kinase
MTYIDYIRDARNEPISTKKLNNVVNEAVAPFASQHRIYTELKDAERMVDVHPDAMRRCLTNIIQNACDHGQQVLIHNHWTAEDLVLEIDDDGPGIPKDQREQALRPFTKGKQEGAGRYGGIGLGLSIASDILAMHQGRLELDESMLGGLRVRLRLPIQNN